MAEFPQIMASETTTIAGSPEQVIPATPDMIFDRWWVQRLRILAPDPNGQVSAAVVITKGSKSEDGVWTLSKDKENTKSFVIEDIFTRAATDAELAQVLGGLLQCIARIGSEMGVL